MTKVRYEIEVDDALFPFAPGSGVVVRENTKHGWTKDVFICFKEYLPDQFYCEDNMWRYCYPLSTHGHLLGTTYPEDTPKCSKCGKAAPGFDGTIKQLRLGSDIVCEKCFADVSVFNPAAPTANGVTEQLAVITAERDKLRDELAAQKGYYTPLLDKLLLTEKQVREIVNQQIHAAPTESKASTPAYPTPFQPFQKVLVRDSVNERWTSALYGHSNHDEEGRQENKK